MPARFYETEPFTIGTPGLYKLACELWHAIGDVNVPILQSVSDVYVHSECVSIKVVNAATNEVLGEVPPAAGATLNIALQGGQDVYLRIAEQRGVQGGAAVRRASSGAVVPDRLAAAQR